MAKLSQKPAINNNNNNNNVNADLPVGMKRKRTRKTIPRDTPPQRSSIYRGVTRFNLMNNKLCTVPCNAMYVLINWFMS